MGGNPTDAFSVEPELQALAVLGAGRGALVMAMFGAGWLGWGLGQARAFNGFTGPAFGFTALLLAACSIHFIREGRLLRRKHPPVGEPSLIMRKRFFLVAAIEVLAIGLASILANRLHRSDLATDWCAMIVGIHFLPLAKIFRAPHLYVFGVLMTVWCALCWALFRASALTISVSLGTGILLWGACVSALFRARAITGSLRS
jgi:hypothetical protein